jgi:hypothetical protein
MYHQKLLWFAMVGVLFVAACRISVNLPDETFQTGPTEVEEIHLPLPYSNDPVHLKLTIGAGELSINPGAADALVRGEITYNVKDFKPQVVTQGNTIIIQQGEAGYKGLPDFPGGFKNVWDLKLGQKPIDLAINAGATESQLELGDLSLVGLTITQGASNFKLSFLQPNRVSMTDLTVSTGASNLTLSGLANAHTNRIDFKSGFGTSTLDFTGNLQSDLSVFIDGAVGNIRIIIPQGTTAEVNVEGALFNVVPRGIWVKSDHGYNMPGEGYKITIKVMPPRRKN